MSSFERCSNCGEYDFLDKHKCQDEWQAIRAEYHDERDYEKAFGYDAESAALKYAENNFSLWRWPEKMEIWVRKPGETAWRKFQITVEAVPSFSASELS